MRKLKRASELQDKRDRIRMGLLPPDPPKGICLWYPENDFTDQDHLSRSQKSDEGPHIGRHSRPDSRRGSRTTGSGDEETWS